MQSLLSFIFDNLQSASPTEVSQIRKFERVLTLLLVYSIVKLRLPDDLLMNALTDQVEV